MGARKDGDFGLEARLAFKLVAKCKSAATIPIHLPEVEFTGQFLEPRKQPTKFVGTYHYGAAGDRPSLLEIYNNSIYRPYERLPQAWHPY